MSMAEDYRNKFISQLHNALSGFTGTDVDEAVRYGFSCGWGFIVNEMTYIDIQSRVNPKQ